MADLFVVAARIAGIGHISDYVGGNEVAQKAVIAKNCVKALRPIPRGGMAHVSSGDHASRALLARLPWARPARTLGSEIARNSGENRHGAPEVRSLPRPASPDRRASDAAIPPRPRFCRSAR